MARDSVWHAVTEYTDLGFDTLPLAPNSKRAIIEGWQSLAPSEMWQVAPSDANVGLRCGGDAQLAVFDADDKHDAQTSARLIRYFAALGFDWADYPTIATPHNGRHFYFRLDGNLDGNLRHLRADIGTGEFRFGRGAYVVAVPSIVEGTPYRLLAGDFRSVAHIEVKDVLPILDYREPTPNTPPEPDTDTPRLSRRAWRLLHGEGIERYPTRSEAEQAILAALANADYDFDAVLSLFLRFPCAGKFRERYAQSPRRAITWLVHSYDEARQFARAHETEGRRRARIALEWAYAHTWNGRTGAVDRAVFIACATIAYRAGSIEFAAPCRTVAELAQVGWKTATRALHRLVDAGLLTLAKPYTAELANVYRLNVDADVDVYHNDTLPNIAIVRKCVTMIQPHDAFRVRGYGETSNALGLGKAARQVWELLQAEPLTLTEIAECTGRARMTVWRALNRMAHIVEPESGEVVALVERTDGGKWRAREGVDLDKVARALGTLGGNEWQRQKHARERAKYRASLKALASGAISRGNE